MRDEVIQEYGYNLQRDGWLNAFTDEKNQAMRNDGLPWRGAREKYHVFFSILLTTLTNKNDVIMDWQCSVGTHSLSTSSLFWIFRYFCFTSFRSNIFPLFALGGSITTCRSLDPDTQLPYYTQGSSYLKQLRGRLCKNYIKLY